MSSAAAQRRALRYDEREPIDGRLVHPRATHGTTSGYSYFGCRCEPCTTAITRRVRKWSDKKLATAVVVDGRRYVADAPHGTVNGYTTYRCQCDPCSAAWTEYMRQYGATAA